VDYLIGSHAPHAVHTHKSEPFSKRFTRFTSVHMNSHRRKSLKANGFFARFTRFTSVRVYKPLLHQAVHTGSHPPIGGEHVNRGGWGKEQFISPWSNGLFPSIAQLANDCPGEKGPGDDYDAPADCLHDGFFVFQDGACGDAAQGGGNQILHLLKRSSCWASHRYPDQGVWPSRARVGVSSRESLSALAEIVVTSGLLSSISPDIKVSRIKHFGSYSAGFRVPCTDQTRHIGKGAV
jgi:hypothetical protein